MSWGQFEKFAFAIAKYYLVKSKWPSREMVVERKILTYNKDSVKNTYFFC